jgi:hypothetical protein
MSFQTDSIVMLNVIYIIKNIKTYLKIKFSGICKIRKGRNPADDGGPPEDAPGQRGERCV